MRLAILGGTFDPIHIAHIEIARQSAEAFRLDRVLLVPAAHPPHKAEGARAPYEHRVRMAELACAVDAHIEVSRIEEGTERSFSIDTIEKVRADLSSGDELFFIIGADAFAEIHSWRRWRDVARAVRFIVVSRPGVDYEIPEGARAERLTNLSLEVSSSEIRRELAEGRCPREVPPPVLQYIFEHRLYGT
jgi:nicotinate-nucleotide adenylyltransferase